MCNYLHENSQPIEEEGIGYKIFTKMSDGTLNTFIFRGKYRVDKGDSWKKWDNEYAGDGFCFCLRYEDAKKFYRCISLEEEDGRNEVIRKIHYRKGLGSYCEEFSKSKITIALCKEFRIIKGEIKNV